MLEQGGTSDQGAKHIAQVKSEIGKLIEFFAKNLPESIRPTDDLWSFAKKNDRRSYQLIRFACVPESDYRKVYKAIVCTNIFCSCDDANSVCLERMHQTSH